MLTVTEACVSVEMEITVTEMMTAMFSVWDDGAECNSDDDTNYYWHDEEVNDSYTGVMMMMINKVKENPS